MRTPEISLCYHPTSTILVDDNRDFLIPFSTYLIRNSGLLCYLYDDPHSALDFLNTQYQCETFINRCIISNSKDEDPANQVAMNFDVTEIHKEIYNPKRFNQVSSLVIDYGMPGINGADFCHQINNPYLNKIMLTGEADKELAVQFFNENKIHQFLMKNTSNLDELLPSILIQMQQNYFLKLSEIALNQQTKQSRQLLPCLSDPVFIGLFNKIYDKAKAVEYYLLDNQGSFFFLDKQGKPSWLIVMNEEELNAYYNIAKYGDAPEAIIKALESRVVVPYFPPTLNRQIPPFAWEKYLHPAKVLNGKERYYYSYVTDAKISDIQHDKIVSYQTYLNTSYQDYLNHSLMA